MKVYMVTYGQYSDYTVGPIFLNKGDAEQHIADSTEADHWDTPDIEEHELYDAPIERVTVYEMSWYRGEQSSKQETKWAHQIALGNRPEVHQRDGWLRVRGTDEQAVFKTYSDRLVQMRSVEPPPPVEDIIPF